MIRILIVDDQKTIRESMRTFFSDLADFEIAGVAVDGYDAIAQVKELQPDIILMDIEMPGLDGMEATKAIIQQYPQTKILILTSHDRDNLIAQSICVGAEGYLLKNMSSTEIVRAIRFVSEGYTKIKPSVGITAKKTSLTPAQSSSPDFSSSLVENSKNINSINLRPATPQEFLPPIQNWLVISGLACLSIFAGAIALSSQLEYKVTVKAPAEIRPLGEMQIVQAATEGKISSILVRENQPVQAGKLIANIDNTIIQSKKQQLLANSRQTQRQLAQLNEQLISIQAQIAAQRNLQQRTLASAQAQLKHQQRLYQQQLITSQAKEQ